MKQICPGEWGQGSNPALNNTRAGMLIPGHVAVTIYYWAQFLWKFAFVKT